MPVYVPRSRAVTILLALAAVLLLAPSATASSGAGSLYPQTNDPGGNAVQRFERARDGSLTPAGTFATGGLGLASLGGRQGAVELSGRSRGDHGRGGAVTERAAPGNTGGMQPEPLPPVFRR
jgi:hypothetical protein